MRPAHQMLGLALLLAPLTCTPAPQPKPGGEAERGDAVSVDAPQEETADIEPVHRAKPVALRLYVMSQCPYSAQLKAQLHQILPRFEGAAELTLEYVGDIGQRGELSSMHGPDEVQGDVIQLCAAQHSTKWFDLVACQDKHLKQVATNWVDCAQELGIPTPEIQTCSTSGEGRRLAAASFARSKADGIRGTPTLLIDGVKYQGLRKPAPLLRAVCRAQASERSDVCATIPEAPRVQVTVLTDSRCSECNAKGLTSQLNARIENLALTVLDVATAEGQAFYESLTPLPLLPAAIFDATLNADPELAAWTKHLQPAGGDLRAMALGAEWNPHCAEAANCALAECQDVLHCRPDKPKKLDLFMMGRCPFGARAITAMRDVLDHFTKHKEKLAFSVYFIGDGDKAAAFKSMHGSEEVAEDLRSVCAIEHYRKNFKFMDYLVCRAKDVKSRDWQACTGKATGISEKIIKTCAEGAEGEKLLAASFAYAERFHMGASPTWLANDKYKFSGVAADKIKTEFCGHNALKGCDVPLAAPPNP